MANTQLTDSLEAVAASHKEKKSKKRKTKVYKFKYFGVNSEGFITSGVVQAETLAIARSQTRALHLTSVTVKPKKSVLQFEITPKKVSQREVMHYTRQLAAFVNAGLPILDSLRTLADEQSNPVFRDVLNQVIDDVRRGEPLSAAKARHPRVFPTFYLGMLQSAELSGNLDLVLDQIADYIDRDQEARRQMKSAMAYPGIILALALVVVVVLTTFVLPRFQTFFKSLNAKLPLPTRMLLSTTAFLGKWWWAIIAGVAAVSFLIFLYQRTTRGRLRRDTMLLKIPVLGEVIRFSIVERFCRVLATMQRAGVPLTKSMTVVSETTNNKVYTNCFSEITSAMVQGQGLAQPVSQSGLFPATMTQMVRVGEETGSLDEQLQNSARFFERELDYKLQRLVALFEPAVLIFVGVVVGFVAIALVSAMYGIYKQKI